MACILLRLRAAETAINDKTSGKGICPRVAWGSNGNGSGGCSYSFGHGNSCSGDSPVSQISAVTSYRKHLPPLQIIYDRFNAREERCRMPFLERRSPEAVSELCAIAKSTCRLKVSTRATKTESSSPTLNRLRDRLPMSWRRAGSNK